MTDWIESRTNLARHRKTRQFAALLGISRPLAVGYLTCWWHRVMEESPEGDLTLWSAADIADGALFDGEPEDFRSALTEAGFLDVAADGGQTPHDWDDYAGRLLDRRRKNAERMRKARASTPPEPAANGVAHVHATSPARARLPTDQPTNQPTNRESARPHEEVTEDFKQKLEDEFCEQLGSRETVRAHIDAALAHTSRLKYTDDRAYLRRWLRDDATRAKTVPPGRNGRPEPVRHIKDNTGLRRQA